MPATGWVRKCASTTFAKWPVDRMAFGTPCRARQRTTHSRNGLPATGTIGLGMPGNRCATRVPNPPASTTATTSAILIVAKAPGKPVAFAPQTYKLP